MTGMNRYIQWKTNNPESYDELLRRRRERYRKNADFRNRQLQHTANYRKRRRRSEEQGSRLPKPKTFAIGGELVECWSAGRMADFLGVTKKTITNLENSGTIPTNHLISTNNHRWWPAEFVEWLQPFFAARKAGITAQEFHRRVWVSWSEELSRGIIPIVTNPRLESKDGHSTEEGQSA